MAVVLSVVLVWFAIAVHRDRGAPGAMRAAASALIALLGLQILLGAQIIWTMRKPEMTTGHVVVGALTLAVTFWLTWNAHRDRIEERDAGKSPSPA
jgi:cytochrome c oxidase assembly protein subunit 15